MSDANSDMEREQEYARLAKLNPNKLMKRLQQLHKDRQEYLQITNDLIKLGFEIKCEDNDKLTFWKEWKDHNENK